MLITYYTGAGSSARSIPTVNRMELRLKYFLYQIKFYLLDIKIPDQLKQYFDEKEKQEFLDEITRTVDNACKHQTVDTYARKLFLKDDKIQLWLLKGVLSLFFEFEQSNIKSYVPSNKTIDDVKITDDFVANVHLRLDDRYDGFFGTFLTSQNGNLELPPEISWITWNYDQQLELSYMDFQDCNFKEAQINLRVCPGIVPYKKSQIIKLNGSTGQFFENEEFKTWNDILDFSFGDHVEDQEYIFYKKIQYLLKNYKSPINIPAFQFSWEIESNKFMKLALEHAKKILKSSNILVIIGYSFPIFNRQVDIELLGNSSFEKVYVQTPESEFKNLLTRMKQVFVGMELIENETVIHYNDLSNFCIPPEIFSERRYSK